MHLLEIGITAGIGAAAFFAGWYIYLQHKRHGCVGCSMAKQCGHCRKNCAKQKPPEGGNGQ